MSEGAGGMGGRILAPTGIGLKRPETSEQALEMLISREDAKFAEVVQGCTGNGAKDAKIFYL
jgi:hypothetical protein